jgi:anti-anti-sigma factor
MAMPEPFDVRVVQRTPIPIVEIVGEFDLSVSDRAWKVIESVISADIAGLTLDMAEVTFVDSRGLSVLARALHAMNGASLTVRGAPERLRHLFEVSGLINLITLE